VEAGDLENIVRQAEYLLHEAAVVRLLRFVA
jgi:hypothetical protein